MSREPIQFNLKMASHISTAELQPPFILTHENGEETEEAELKNSVQASSSVERFKKKKDYVLIDSDGGIDDARAIFMVEKAQRSLIDPLKITAITCVNGNTTVDNVAINVTRVLDTANDSQVRVR
jgi:hypothetical protein